MKRRLWVRTLFLFAISGLLVFSACKTAKIDPGAGGPTTDKPAEYSTSGSGTTGGPGTGMTEEEIRQRESEAARQKEIRAREMESTEFINKDIYFDYDSSTLKPESVEILKEKVEYLRRYQNTQITIEGHCDERGTDEYNMALGERRAESTKTYLTRNGVAAERISTISYGEEKPIASGNSEDSWWQNRRAHCIIK